jgi:L-amino acid N-acyltransferase YncA
MVVLACWVALCVAWGAGVMVPRVRIYRERRAYVEAAGRSIVGCLKNERMALARGDLKAAAEYASQCEFLSEQAFTRSIRQFGHHAQPRVA